MAGVYAFIAVFFLWLVLHLLSLTFGVAKLHFLPILLNCISHAFHMHLEQHSWASFLSLISPAYRSKHPEMHLQICIPYAFLYHYDHSAGLHL